MIPTGVGGGMSNNNQSLINNRTNFQNSMPGNGQMMARQNSGSQGNMPHSNNNNTGLVGNFSNNNLQSRLGGPLQQQQQQPSILGMGGPSIGMGQQNNIRPNQNMYNNNSSNFNQRNTLNNQNSIMGNRPPFNSINNNSAPNMPMRPSLPPNNMSNMSAQQNNLGKIILNLAYLRFENLSLKAVF
jgi:hypothetical protein